MHHKRGQGSAAASLVGIIALLIVFYILFLPAEDRRDLLLEEDNLTRLGIDRDNDLDEHTLLLATIGTLDEQPRSEYEHTIPNVHLVETKNAEVIEEFNPFLIRNNWFTTDNKQLTFTIADPEVTSNAKLVLDAPTQEGVLTVQLNNRVIYESGPTQVNIQPINLKDEQLQRSNTLDFSVSGVGAAFWNTNKYQFSNAQIIADITDLGRQESENTFIIETVEYNNLERATLTFFPVCEQGDVGPLEVNLNGRTISTNVPDCETVNRLELNPDDLVMGRNSIFFQITEGSYRLEQIKVDTELTEEEAFLDFFELNETRYEDVEFGRKELILRIEFIDDDETKRAELNINGRRDFIDQRDPVYERNLKSFAVEDNNYIQIIPKTELNIVELEVTLE
jgi:hypothetical protein